MLRFPQQLFDQALFERTKHEIAMAVLTAGQADNAAALRPEAMAALISVLALSIASTTYRLPADSAALELKAAVVALREQVEAEAKAMAKRR